MNQRRDSSFSQLSHNCQTFFYSPPINSGICYENVCPSVRSSVRHTGESRLSGSIYRNMLCILRQNYDVSSFLRPNLTIMNLVLLQFANWNDNLQYCSEFAVHILILHRHQNVPKYTGFNAPSRSFTIKPVTSPVMILLLLTYRTVSATLLGAGNTEAGHRPAAVFERQRFGKQTEKSFAGNLTEYDEMIS